MVEVKGVPTKHTNEWRKVLREVDDAVNVWGATYALKNRAGVPPVNADDDDGSAEGMDAEEDTDVEEDALDQV